eukprot:PLAT6647.2.p1 GENE.PLAT6647.2~~PLAT6647.2.p1  ORF type:complete len:327 (+),score=110.93 PLAT6647.2:107-1087(+)
MKRVREEGDEHSPHDMADALPLSPLAAPEDGSELRLSSRRRSRRGGAMAAPTTALAGVVEADLPALVLHGVRLRCARGIVSAHDVIMLVTGVDRKSCTSKWSKYNHSLPQLARGVRRVTFSSQFGGRQRNTPVLTAEQFYLLLGVVQGKRQPQTSQLVQHLETYAWPEAVVRCPLAAAATLDFCFRLGPPGSSRWEGYVSSKAAFLQFKLALEAEFEVSYSLRTRKPRATQWYEVWACRACAARAATMPTGTRVCSKIVAKYALEPAATGSASATHSVALAASAAAAAAASDALTAGDAGDSALSAALHMQQQHRRHAAAAAAAFG